MNKVIRLGRRRRRGSARLFGGFKLQRGTLILIGLSCVCTIIGYGIPTLGAQFLIRPSTIPNAEILAVVTNTFMAMPSSLFGLMIVLGIAAYFFWDTVKMVWAQRRVPIVVGTVAALFIMYGFDALLGRGVAAGLLTDVFMLVWFGGIVERIWGTRRFLLFCGIIVCVVNVIGAHLAWIWPGSLGALVTSSQMPVGGAGPLIDGLMALWCLMHAKQRLAILNIEAGKLVWFLVLINGLELLLRGTLAGLMGLIAIGLAQLLVTGNWRPKKLLDRFRLWRIDRRIKQRRRKIRVVDNDRTLH